MLLRLLKYDYVVEYIPGKEMYIADALSRSYVKDHIEDDPEMLYIVHALSQNISISEKKRKEFEVAFEQDEVLSKVIECKKTNQWMSNLSTELKHYYKIKDDIFVSNNLLFLNDKLIIPTSLKTYILELLHTGHIGIDKTIVKARQHVYWPNMTKDITDYVNSCYNCQKYRHSNCKEPLQPYPITERPWERIAADIFETGNECYLVMIDSYSNWIELAKIENKTAHTVILVLKEVFSRMGIPDIVVTDNNPFNNYVFKQFSEDYGFKHTTSSPRYPKSNGLAEKGVNIAKNLIRKCQTLEEIRLGLMEYRNTPLKFIGYSPAELIMSRKLRTKLPCSSNKLIPQTINHSNVRNRLKFRQNQQINYYNKGARKLPNLKINEHILLKKDRIWVPAIVLECYNDNSYLVKDNDGQKFRRNRIFLRTTLVTYGTETGSYSGDEILIDTYKFKKNGEVPESFDTLNENINQSIHNENVNQSVDKEKVDQSFNSKKVKINQTFHNRSVDDANGAKNVSSHGRKYYKPAYLEDYDCEAVD